MGFRSNFFHEISYLYRSFDFYRRGACGEVRLAFDKNDNSRHAVKIINKKTFSVTVNLNLQEIFLTCTREHSTESVFVDGEAILKFSKYDN